MHDTYQVLNNTREFLFFEWERSIGGSGSGSGQVTAFTTDDFPGMPISVPQQVRSCFHPIVCGRGLANVVIAMYRLLLPSAQDNEYDCGLFVLTSMELFCREAPDVVTNELWTGKEILEHTA